MDSLVVRDYQHCIRLREYQHCIGLVGVSML